MFDIGPGEFFLIALVALIVFGPERLPDIARKVGGYLSEVRKAAGDLRAGLDEEVRQIQAPLEELKADLTKPVTEVKKTLDETSATINEQLEELGKADGTKNRRRVEWIAPEPSTGVKPDEAWQGLEDSVPDGTDVAGDGGPSDLSEAGMTPGEEDSPLDTLRAESDVQSDEGDSVEDSPA